jgi:hypothetical protein
VYAEAVDRQEGRYSDPASKHNSIQVHFLTTNVAKDCQLNNQGSPADEILGIAQLEAVGFEQLSWWHRVMIILPIRRGIGSVAMSGAVTQVIRIVVSVGRTRARVRSFRHL